MVQYFVSFMKCLLCHDVPLQEPSGHRLCTERAGTGAQAGEGLLKMIACFNIELKKCTNDVESFWLLKMR